MRMRIGLWSIVALTTCGIVSPSRANAQTVPGYGYAFAGPAAVSNIGVRAVALNIGGGGEVWVGGGVSVGGELGLVSFPAVEQRTSCCVVSASSATALLVSANASRHFVRSVGPAQWRPFITGGISVVAGGEAVGLFNAGGGAERWISPHAGIRLEIRDQFVLASNPSVLLGFRAGVVFR